MPCSIHPSAATFITLFNRPYCARCHRDIQAAIGRLDNHVTPRDCFIWYTGRVSGWAPIAGTGCAHYVAHQLGIRSNQPGACCLAGYVYRVPAIISTGRLRVTEGLNAVRVNNIWVNSTRDHTGLVSRIDPPPAQPTGAPPAPPVIWITHASSRQHRLSSNRFDTYFHNSGEFFR